MSATKRRKLGVSAAAPSGSGSVTSVVGRPDNDCMESVLVPVPDADGRRRWLVGDGDSGARLVDASGVAELERGRPRWLLDGAEHSYPDLLAAGVRLSRCHDVRLAERILLGRVGIFGAPLSAAAVLARRAGLAVPPDQPAAGVPDQPGLFETGPRRDPAAELSVVAAAVADQRSRIGRDNALRLLVAAESVGGLAAVEMSAHGLPWATDEHDRRLTELLGPRPAPGGRPAVLGELADQISAAFGFAVNPDSVADVRQAFGRVGLPVESTRKWVLAQIEHPAVPLVQRYKELARLFTANGWNWMDIWVRGGRLRTDYQPGAVVSGRWATRGGGGLQIPRTIRSAARAEPGHRLIVADAAQLEPRVLAAVSGDPALSAVCTEADMYSELAADGFGGDRAAAKLAMLGAMYGQTSGEAGRLIGTLRARYPIAVAFVETAARQGESGGVVRTILGRMSPPPGDGWREAIVAGSDETAGAAAQRRGRERARAWGRFARNFVVQGSAADWAAVWLSSLRQALMSVPGAELVFFQHDELVVHAPADAAQTVAELARESAETARRLVFPGAMALTPVHPVVVGNYAQAK